MSCSSEPGGAVPRRNAHAGHSSRTGYLECEGCRGFGHGTGESTEAQHPSHLILEQPSTALTYPRHQGGCTQAGNSLAADYFVGYQGKGTRGAAKISESPSESSCSCADCPQPSVTCQSAQGLQSTTMPHKTLQKYLF